jgi:tRNA (cytidine/uridine-2'-O-)-methyltransferase
MMSDEKLRLRARPLPSPPRIVLVDPEIPQNTGNIARLAAALSCPLHLVGRLGFRIDDKAVRRAGLDYWHLVQLERHLDFAHFRNAHPEARVLLFTASAPRSYLDARYEAGDALVFGCESTGLPEALCAAHPDATHAIPTLGPVRSLNLANAVAVVAYECLRQQGALAGAALGR